MEFTLLRARALAMAERAWHGSSRPAPRAAARLVDAGRTASDTPRAAPNAPSRADRSRVHGEAPSVAVEIPRADPQAPVAATPAHASAAMATVAIARAEFLGVTEKNLDEEDVEESAASRAPPTNTRVSAPRSGEASILASATCARRCDRWTGRGGGRCPGPPDFLESVSGVPGKLPRPVRYLECSSARPHGQAPSSVSTSRLTLKSPIDGRKKRCEPLAVQRRVPHSSARPRLRPQHVPSDGKGRRGARCCRHGSVDGAGIWIGASPAEYGSAGG